MAADLSGRAALITGAASGIGRASAVAFAAAGASVALVDINADGLAETEAAARALGVSAEVIQADVTDLVAVTAAVVRTVEVFGRLDAAHNNAGVPGPYLPLDEYSEEDFLRVVQVDLVGVWRCMRAEIRHMRAQRAGAIVNTSSMLGAAAMPDNGGLRGRQAWRARPDPRCGAGIGRHRDPGQRHRPRSDADRHDLGSQRRVAPQRAAPPHRGTGGDRRSRGLAVLARSLLHHWLGAGRRRRVAGRMTSSLGRSRP